MTTVIMLASGLIYKFQMGNYYYYYYYKYYYCCLWFNFWVMIGNLLSFLLLSVDTVISNIIIIFTISSGGLNVGMHFRIENSCNLLSLFDAYHSSLFTSTNVLHVSTITKYLTYFKPTVLSVCVT